MLSITDEPIELAVIGAGPIGIETAACAATNDWNVHVFERDAVGAHVARWSHVPFFSDWSLDRSPWGEALLERNGVALDPASEHPTGGEYLDRYLRPLAETPALEGCVHEQHEVLGIARRDALKTEHVGSPDRAASPFVLRVDGGEAVSYVQADVVIDATGSYDIPNGLGRLRGSLGAPGEGVRGLSRSDVIRIGATRTVADSRN